MPWRLIVFIVVFAVFLVFITFNLENYSDISFGFFKIERVPVFLTIFVSFALGALFSLPFVFAARKKHKGLPAKDAEQNKSKAGAPTAEIPTGDHKDSPDGKK